MIAGCSMGGNESKPADTLCTCDRGPCQVVCIVGCCWGDRIRSGGTGPRAPLGCQGSAAARLRAGVVARIVGGPALPVRPGASRPAHNAQIDPTAEGLEVEAD